MVQLTPSIPADSGVRRGACPSLDAPMATGDGQLTRFRPIAGELDIAALSGIARAAQRFGNGRVEITSRGSVQLRGLSPETSAACASTLRDAIAIETGIPVETPPLAGLLPDTQKLLDLAATLRRALSAFAGRVPAKTSIVIDDGSLAGIGADIRIRPEAGGWRIGGEHFADADALVFQVKAALSALRQRRPGRAAEASEFPLGTGQIGELRYFALALPQGGVEAGALLDLAALLETLGISGMRLGPMRRLFLIGADIADAPFTRLGFIASPADPRAQIASCAGGRGCASGRFDAATLGERVAQAAPGLSIAICACEKRCVRAGLLSLTGHADGFRLEGQGIARSFADADAALAFLATRKNPALGAAA